ncbi:hypothetical protein KV557_40605 [Kitasatospora aureofaciens]|uniref:hypothetical protein n=1 Tax=Kitasatospora aureofaciens TaxID=1894 RepID=UPI001C440E04|nr:hypothetical protein [Kitasatospora aureofaciens]MBV6703317.1 hypothetical protein [Kitasatospora aureofaciens]
MPSTSIHAEHGGVAAGYIGVLRQHLADGQVARIDRPRPVVEWTAQQLGVHPAIHGVNPPDNDYAFVLPTYLERDHDQKLRSCLLNAACGEQAVLVLVRGSSCSGKTRAAFEAVRACLHGWQLAFPKTPRALLDLLNAGALAAHTVLWLNEAQNYLDGPGGEEAAAALRSRMEESGPLLVLGTLWPEYHHNLTATPQPGQRTTDAHPNARALLDQAVLVDVPPSFTAEALGRVFGRDQWVRVRSLIQIIAPRRWRPAR